LLTSDVIAADVELDQRPHARDSIRKGVNTCKPHTAVSKVI
jgi:hypothetical protein